MKYLKNLLVGVSVFCAIMIITLSLLMISSANAAGVISLPRSMTYNIGFVERWQIHRDMDRGRGDPGVVVVNDKIHVISGFFSPGFCYVNNQEVYDPKTGIWETIWQVPLPRSDFVALYHNGLIYTIGGWIDPIKNCGLPYMGVLGINHVYNPVDKTWDTNTAAPLPTAVSGAAGVVLDDKLYIIGGYKNDLTDTNIVQIYDPASNTWFEQATPMNSARSEFGAVVLDGEIYAIGGNKASGSFDVEIYDPVANSWRNGPALPERRSRMAVTLRQGNIYVIGGSENDPCVAKDTMFVYDHDTEKWSTGDPMPTARSANRATVIGDIIYVIGGTGEESAGKANEAYGLFPPLLYLPLVNR